MTTGGASLHAGRSPDGWPQLASEAMYGLAGGFVRMVGPHSESDHAALIFQFLTAYGNCIGRNAYFVAEADRHYANGYCLIVGATAKGRKGTSYGHVKGIFNACDEDWVQACQQHGLSSGEGLIWVVRDPIEKEEPVRENRRAVDRQVADEGVTDKRLLVVESNSQLVHLDEKGRAPQNSRRRRGRKRSPVTRPALLRKPFHSNMLGL